MNAKTSRRFAVGALLAACIWIAAAAWAGDLIDQRASVGTLWYEKFENGEKIGWMEVRFAAVDESGRKVLETRSNSSMTLARPDGPIHFEGRDRSLFDENVHLISFDTTLTVDGKPVPFSGRRTDEGFALRVGEGDRQQVKTFPKADYDYVTADEVHRALEKPGDERSWRMLDLESFTVQPVTYRLEREEACPAPREDATCTVLYYRKGGDVSNAWLVKETGVLVRQRGVSDAGSYEVLLSNESKAREGAKQ